MYAMLHKLGGMSSLLFNKTIETCVIILPISVKTLLLKMWTCFPSVTVLVNAAKE